MATYVFVSFSSRAALFKCQSGSTAIEYGLIGGLVSVGIIAAVIAVGSDVSLLYDRIAASMPTTG